MGFTYYDTQPDITFTRDTPRGPQFLLSLQRRATGAKLYEPTGFFGERWGTVTRLVDYPRNVPVPSWAVYGPPTSRPLAPLAAKQMANYTTLGLWQQMQKKGGK